MAVYRFRIWFEDQEDIYREIDVQTRQNFAEFHRVIQEAVGFDNSKDASFFISDDYWRKGREIALNPIVVDDDDDDDYRRPKKPKPLAMRDALMATYIDDPHQKFLYIFDPKVLWTFCVELVKIVDDEPKTTYPKITKSIGVAPKQYKVTTPPPDVDEEDDLIDDDEPQKEKVFSAEEQFEPETHSGAETDEFVDASESEGESNGESEEGADDDGGDAFGFGDSDTTDDY